LSVPDEGYYSNTWCTLLFTLSVPDEGYYSNTWCTLLFTLSVKSNTSNLKDFGRKKANNVISYTAVYILYIFHHQSAVLIFTKHNENPMVVHFLQVPSVISGITYMYDCILEHPLHFGKKKQQYKK
jgi:hypothetical protein